MHVLVAHASRHGSTTEVAARIAERLRELGHDATLRTARDRAPLDGHDLVVVGGSLYTGRWHADAQRFLRRHRGDLGRVPVAVFAMGPRRDDPDAWTAARDQLESALAKLAWLDPAAIAVFGGKDPKPKHGVVRDLRDWAAVDAWAESLVGGGPTTR
ncbi:MAG: flavodoxin domain-containing protein [Actinomycetales bacterium]|nr:flavodoxin domain-containing protein [Actinomycetales bacterium]